MLTVLLLIAIFLSFISITGFSIAYFLFKKLKKKIKKRLSMTPEEIQEKKLEVSFKASMKAMENPYPFFPILKNEPIEHVRYFISSLPMSIRRYFAKELVPSNDLRTKDNLGFNILYFYGNEKKIEDHFMKKVKDAIKDSNNPYHQLELCRFLLPPDLSKEIFKIQQAIEKIDEEIADEMISILVAALEAKEFFEKNKNYEINHKLNTLIEYDLLDLITMYKQLNRTSQRDKKQEILRTLSAIKEELLEIEEFSQSKSKFEFDRKMTSLLKKYNKK